MSEASLEPYEQEVLKQMYDKQLIGGRYVAVQQVRAKVRWDRISGQYRAKRSFDHVIRRLVRKGFVDDHGKSRQVASLSALGVAYVHGLLRREGQQREP